MTKRMLIDSTHAEEIRVVVLDGNRLEDFDVETSTKRQLKGNIYLAKVVRVEPSLQAAFVEYGGGRHGFLAFGEIHPDYYQIPVADRQRLLEMQAEDARRDEEEEDRAAAAEEAGETVSANVREIEISDAEPETIEHGMGAPAAHGDDDGGREIAETPAPVPADVQPPMDEPQAGEFDGVEPGAAHGEPADAPEAPEPSPHGTRAQSASIGYESVSDTVEALAPAGHEPQPEFAFAAPPVAPEADPADRFGAQTDGAEPDPAQDNPFQDNPSQDNGEEQREPRLPPRFMRNYKIQEVIKRRQILLIQVVKEERGTKGAALTTFISLAGRFCVLMPNSPRGGGISRKITSAADRRRLKEITAELAIPKGMGLIVRTAGAQRPKPEIKRDCEYLMRLWDDIREHTMRSVAPALIYEEASLIKRAIRDVYSRDVDEILVDGEEGWRAAHDFMRMLMPTHAKKVQLWRDPQGQPLFARHQVDAQLDAMMSPTVQLKSGGYLVINQAEALVAVDVNSGRSTRERGIEETALRTNLEAADEVARQLRLRDLAGLIVIDFIDMEAKKHNAMVERRLKEALKNDRARIQIGQISHFGLLEMSRQRLRPSLAETSFVPCSHCGGLGHVRSTESAAIQVLRAIEEEGAKRRSAEIVVYAATSIALYVLNHKRERLIGIEARYGMHVTFASDESLLPPNIRIERLRAQLPGEGPATITPDAWAALSPPVASEAEIEDEDDIVTAEAASDEGDEEADDATEARATGTSTGTSTETPEEAERSRRKRRRRRRGGKREDGTPDLAAQSGDAEREPAIADGETTGSESRSADEAGVPKPAEEYAEPAGDEAKPAGDDSKPASAEAAAETAPALSAEDEEAQRRRRGRRGGRRRRRDEDTLTAVAEPGAEQPDMPPAYSGPTPANPFAGQGYDIFDAMERAEEQAAMTAQAPMVVLAETSSVEAQGVEPETVEPATVVAELAMPEAAVAQTLAVEPDHPTPAAPAGNDGSISPAPLMETPVDMPVDAPVDAKVELEPEPVMAHADAAPATVADEPPAPVAEAFSGPVIQPVVIDAADEPPLAKKRGWWRR